MSWTEKDQAEMERWCELHKNDPYVLAWLEEDGVPEEWQGTPLEYAYTEMPRQGSLAAKICSLIGRGK